MIRTIKYLLVILCFSCVPGAYAQETQPGEIYLDTTYITEAPVESEEELKEFGYFDSVPRIAERSVDKEALNKLRNDEAYWYANMEIKPKKKKPQEPQVVVQKTNWVDTLFWILLVGGFVALLIWLLSSSNISLFQRPSALVEETEEEP